MSKTWEKTYLKDFSYYHIYRPDEFEFREDLLQKAVSEPEKNTKIYQ